MNKALAEVKNSIRNHMVIAGGPSAQLAVLLTKLIDVMECEERDSELNKLAFHITESIAVSLCRAFSETLEASKSGFGLHESILAKRDELLVAIESSRKNTDYIVAKHELLKIMATFLKTANIHSSSRYPALIDADGNEL